MMDLSNRNNLMKSWFRQLAPDSKPACFPPGFSGRNQGYRHGCAHKP